MEGVKDLIPSYRDSLRLLRQGMRRAELRSQSEPDPEVQKRARVDRALMRGMEEGALVVLAYLEGRCPPPADNRAQVMVVDPRLLEAVNVAPAPWIGKQWWEASNKLEDALLRLDEREREAVVMVLGAGFSYREAAKLMGCTVSTVHYRAAQGLAKLREWFRALHLAGQAG